jgi:hypothetical protein
MKTEVAVSSETLAVLYRVSYPRLQQFHSHGRENFKSREEDILFIAIQDTGQLLYILPVKFFVSSVIVDIPLVMSCI